MAVFVVQRRVEFYDTDMAGIVHFANYYRFMEVAEHELFRTLGLTITGHLPDGTKFGWPRVASRCSYSAPAVYDDLVEIRLRIAQRSPRALTTAYEFYCGEKKLAEGEMTSVFCVIPPGQPMRSAAMPDQFAAALDRFAAQPG
jgi:YbgC/YbaW family acyl-CoA thioester hydrolase